MNFNTIFQKLKVKIIFFCGSFFNDMWIYKFSEKKMFEFTAGMVLNCLGMLSLVYSPLFNYSQDIQRRRKTFTLIWAKQNSYQGPKQLAWQSWDHNEQTLRRFPVLRFQFWKKNDTHCLSREIPNIIVCVRLSVKNRLIH